MKRTTAASNCTRSHAWQTGQTGRCRTSRTGCGRTNNGILLQEEEEQRDRERERREDDALRDMLHQLDIEETLARVEARIAQMQLEEAETHWAQIANSLKKVKTGIEKV